MGLRVSHCCIYVVVVAVGEGVPETGLANTASLAPRQPSSQHARQPTASPSLPASNK